LAILVLAPLAAFYAALDDWLGTRSYGPRYLVPLLPLLVAPLAAWWSRATRGGRRMLSALVVASIAIQIPAVVLDFSRVGIAAAQPPQGARQYSWRWAPLVLNAAETIPAVRRNLDYLAGSTPLPPPAMTGPLQARVGGSLDFWWLYLYRLAAVSRTRALILAAVPLTMGLVLIGVAVARARVALPGAPA
jgi:hypothetical protein